jgi:ribosomal protein S18 acetylase RimI-like enzyme
MTESEITVRPFVDPDSMPLASLLNEIIARGGTTAMQEPMTPGQLADLLLSGPDVICCFVAEHPTSKTLLGFQSLIRSEDLDADIGDIATFTRVGMTHRGVGSRLFAATRVAARKKDLRELNATIRCDNFGGLTFYERIGFIDRDILRQIPLRDGSPVDRIIKRYTV